MSEFYRAAYSLQDPAEAAQAGRWRALGASVKVGHVRELLDRVALRPESVVEIGCGDGALLCELVSVVAIVDGFEVSEPAAELARARGVARRVEAYDGQRLPVADDSYSLAVLSHVVEHISDPLPVLREAARVASWVLVEVPLEANRSAARAGKRAEAARIGHVQFFSRGSVRGLLAAAGLVVVEELSDPLPREHHAFFDPGPKAALKWGLRFALWRVSPRLAARLFTLHYAALCRRESAPRAGEAAAVDW